MGNTVDGTILSIIYQNEENGYTVLRLVTDDGELVTCVGCVPYAAPGEDVIFTGAWVNHAQHGQQFRIDQAERHLPSAEAGILTYLSSGIIKGVGPATAQRLVDAFGDDTLRVLEEEPGELSKIRGITAKKAREIIDSYRYQTGMRRLLEFLARYDLPLPLAVRLYRRYGVDAARHLKENPYLLADDLYGVDFSLLDEIALSLGVQGDSSRRLEAALLFELCHNLHNGHVFLPREKLLLATAQLVHCESGDLEPSLEALIARRSIVTEQIGKVEACYLYRMWEAERYTADKLRRMTTFRPDVGKNVDRLIDRIQKEQNITYAGKQREAVELAATQGTLLLTGGPGTGKTTSVRGIVALFESLGLEIALLAPTGRAAQRMTELTGREAQTIHRCLGMSFNEQTGEVSFSKNEKEPLAVNAIIVDEMSMVDLPLMRALLAALPDDCRMVLVGDPDQLPSVGAGNVFSDLIGSGLLPTVALTEIFRQAQESAIVRNAHAVNTGHSPCLENKQNDFFFLSRRDPQRLVDTVVGLCKTRLPDNMGIPPGEIQVLCPTRKGAWGTVELNRALQAALNPPAPEKRQKQWGEVIFRVGDRVMQTRNNYDVLWEREDGTVGAGIFNGDVGQVTDIDPSGELISVIFDGRRATYTADMLSDLDMAYATTVHKAQGSEYRAVILAVQRCAPALMVRGVLYTAITRARELMIVTGDDSAVIAMAENNRQQRRYSGLKRRLRREQEIQDT